MVVPAIIAACYLLFFVASAVMGLTEKQWYATLHNGIVIGCATLALAFTNQPRLQANLIALIVGCALMLVLYYAVAIGAKWTRTR